MSKRTNPAEKPTAIKTEQSISETLYNACMAALSQLTEDREEYLQSDIAQLREAIAAYEAAK